MLLPKPPRSVAGAASASAQTASSPALPARARARALVPSTTTTTTPRRAGRPLGRVVVRAGEGDAAPGGGGTPSSAGDAATPAGGGEKIADTLSALDALLGVEPTPPAKEEEAKPSGAGVSFSPDVLRQLAEAEAGRAGAASPSNDKDAIAKDLADKMAAVADAAKRAAAARARGESSGTTPSSTPPPDEAKAEADLRAAFEKLVSSVSAPGMGGADRADLQKLKDEVFGPRLFWVTEATPVDPFLADGWLIKGNLRTDRATAFKAVREGTARLFGDKYVVLMVEDVDAAMDAMMDGGGGGAGGPPGKGGGGAAPRPEPRIAFQIVTAAAAAPPAAPGWQPLAAAILAALTAGSALQLGMAANISRLPPEVLEWLADPNGLAGSGGSGALPPFVENFDPSSFVGAALPLAGAVLGVQAVHEVGHALVARARGIKTSLPLLVPNGQLGTFGGITQLRSLLPDRAALFDFAAAGPLAGGALAAVLFVVGLALSGGGGPVPDAASAADTALATTGGLLPVPAALLQGSLLLGGVAKAALGSGGVAAAGSTTAAGALGAIASRAAPVVLVHPLVVVGWAGLVSTALNLLPVGRLDGGRMVQAAFGNTALGVASFLTYVGLALGFLGSALALPFGLYVLICQRDPEASPADGVTPPPGPRGVVAAVAIGLALLVLLPAAPEVVDAGRAGGMFM